jgi:hypothetical protein
MTAQPIQAVLDTASARMLFASLTYPAGASAQDIIEVREGALAWLAELAPRDRAQSALAVRVIALHHVTLHHLAQTVQRELSDDLVVRHSGRATTAARMMDRAMEALQARQMMPPMRAMALPAGIGALVTEVVQPAAEVMAQPEEAVLAPEVVEAAVEAAPPDAPAEMPAAAVPVSPAAPAAPTGWVAKRLQDLEEMLTRGEDLTAAQQAWRRRYLAPQGESAALAHAA